MWVVTFVSCNSPPWWWHVDAAFFLILLMISKIWIGGMLVNTSFHVSLSILFYGDRYLHTKSRHLFCPFLVLEWLTQPAFLLTSPVISNIWIDRMLANTIMAMKPIKTWFSALYRTKIMVQNWFFVHWLDWWYCSYKWLYCFYCYT